MKKAARRRPDGLFEIELRYHEQPDGAACARAFLGDKAQI